MHAEEFVQIICVSNAQLSIVGKDNCVSTSYSLADAASCWALLSRE